jgi:hypothetical protein
MKDFCILELYKNKENMPYQPKPFMEFLHGTMILQNTAVVNSYKLFAKTLTVCC